MVGSYLETTWNPTSVGDNGTSFGPFQMHIGGELTAQGGTPQQAEDPVWAAQHMLAAYTRGVSRVNPSLWQSDPGRAAEQAAVFAEVPAQDYYSTQGSQRVQDAWNASLRYLQGNPGTVGQTPNYQNATGLPASLLDKLIGMFGVPDIKDLAERGGLIVFGAILVFVGLFVATKSSGKVKEKIKEQLPNGQEETITKEEPKPKNSSGGGAPIPAKSGEAGMGSEAAGASEGLGEAAIVAV